MPQMSPMMWYFFPFIMMFLSIVVVSVINFVLSIDMGVESLGEVDKISYMWYW